MIIGNNSPHYSNYTRNSIKSNNNSSFENCLEKIKDSDKKPSRDRFVQSEAMEFSPIGLYSKVESKVSGLEFPIETERYTIDLTNEIEGVETYIIRDKELGKGLYIKVNELVIQKDPKTGIELIINMELPIFLNLYVTDELKSALADISKKRGLELQTVPMQEGLTISQDAETGLNYMTIKGQEGKAVAVLTKSIKDRETIENLAQEFMKYPNICSSKEIAWLYALLEIAGNVKRGAEGCTFLTPNGVSYSPYDGDPEKAWNINMSESYYATARERLAAGIDIEDSDAWSKVLQGASVTKGFFEVWKFYDNDNTWLSYRYGWQG